MQIGDFSHLNRAADTRPTNPNADREEESCPSLRARLRPQLKRVFDQVMAALLLAFLAPALTIVAILLVAEGGQVLVRHPRIGCGGAGFQLLRFRTQGVGGKLSATGAVLR